MKVRTRKKCPKCNCELKYNKTNLKRYITKDGRVKCKNCGYPLSKQISKELDKKSVVKRLTS